MTPRNPPQPTSVVFVCLGNICRSPLAEGVFASMAEASGLGEQSCLWRRWDVACSRREDGLRREAG